MFVALFAISLFVSGSSPVSVVGVQSQEMATGLKILVYVGHSAYHTDAAGFAANYTDAGNTVVVSNNATLITELSNDNWDAVLVSQSKNFNTTEITAFRTWFEMGEKLLWVGGDSDFGGFFQANETNPLLEGIKSHLRLFGGSIEDPQSKDGASYRVVVNETGVSSPFVDEATAGFKNATFHGPSAVLGYDYDNSKYVDLRNMSLASTGIDIIVNSSAAAVAIDGDLSLRGDDLYAVSNVSGNYPMMVAERFNNSMVIVSGEANFMDYKNMYGTSFEKSGQHSDGSKLVDNTIKAYFGTILGRDTVDIVVRTETETETETETSTQTDTATTTESVTATVTADPVTVTASETATFTQTKTETPLSILFPFLSLAVVAVIVYKKRN